MLKKHMKKPDEVKKSMAQIEKAKAKYSKEMSEVEENLVEYFKKIDPVLDPATGKCVAWSKRPSMKQLEQMGPFEMDESLTIEKQNKLQMEWAKNQIKIIAELIPIPKHDWEWWWEKAGLDFVLLYQAHIGGLMAKLATNIENL